MKQCEDSEGCTAEAAFTYTWPGTDTVYAGCTRHAYKAAAVVGNMGRTLELVPIGGGPAEVIGGRGGGAATTREPVFAEHRVAELEQRVDSLHSQGVGLRGHVDSLASEGRELRGRVETLERAKAPELGPLEKRVAELERQSGLLPVT